MDGALVHVRIYRPAGEGPFPTVVFVPPADRAAIVAKKDRWNQDIGKEMDMAEYLTRHGIASVLYNPPGRGIGEQASSGRDNQGGYMDQDALATVILYTAQADFIDPDNIGICSRYEGLSAAAGALARYQDLPVRYLIDVEGPFDNLELSGYTWNQVTPRSAEEHVRKSSVYYKHLPTAMDPSPEAFEYWRTREPKTWAPDIHLQYYQRVQFEFDHAQPPAYYAHAMRMYETLLAYGNVAHARYNERPWDAALPPYRIPAPVPGHNSDYIYAIESWIVDLALMSDSLPARTIPQTLPMHTLPPANTSY